MTYRGRAATKMTCGFSVSPGKLSFACVPLALSPGCIARFSGPSRHPPATRPPLLPRTDLPSPLPSGPMGVAAQHLPIPIITMLSFLAWFAALVRGVLSGFYRLFFCGSLLRFSHCRGLQHYLWEHRIPYKDFAAHSLEVTARLEEASLRLARQHGREIRYLNSAQHPNEDIDREIDARDRIKEGLICVLQCRSLYVVPDPQEPPDAQTRDPVPPTQVPAPVSLPDPSDLRLHAHPHPDLVSLPRLRLPQRSRVAGPADGPGRTARTRAPRQHVHLAGRPRPGAGLARPAGRRPTGRSCWTPAALAANPAQSEILARFPCHYYWSVSDSEWASDVLFPSPEALATVYPRLLRYAITTFTPVDVMRFLGQPVPASGKVPHACRHEISSNIKERREGVRIKHWLNGNSLKMYDKGSVLRVETLIRDPGDFKVYRPLEGDPQGPKEWRPLQGVCDLPRRAEVSQAANERLPGGARPQSRTRHRCGNWSSRCAGGPRAPRSPPPQPSRPTDRVRRRGRRVGPSPAAARPAAVQGFRRARRWFHAEGFPRPASAGRRDRARHRRLTGPRRHRRPDAAASASAARRGRARRRRPRGWRWAPAGVGALNPLAAGDAALLEAVSRHEFLLNGLRNRDLRGFSTVARVSAAEQRRQSAAVTRQLRLLRWPTV